MPPRLKPLLIGLGLLAAVVAIGTVIWWQFFLVPVPPGANANRSFLGRVLPEVADRLRGAQNRNGRIVNGPIPTLNVKLPQPAPVANGGPTTTQPIAERDAQGLTPVSGGFGYYDGTTGELFRLTPDGLTRSAVGGKTFPGADSVVWSPDGQKVVLAFPDDSQVVYDLEKRQQVTLPSEAQDVVFSPDSQSLAYKFLGRDQDDRYLTVTNADGSNAKFIEKLGDRAHQVDVDWSPNRQVVATFARGATATQQEVIFLGQNNENFPSATVAGRGFQSRWAPDGQSILYTVRTPDSLDNPTLWIMDGRPESLGQRQVSLGLETFVDKCAFAPGGSSVYCAVPEFLPEGAGLVPEVARGIPDDLYRIDLRTGSRQLVARPTDATGSLQFSATDLVVSTNEEFLYFRDAPTGSVRQVRLK